MKIAIFMAMLQISITFLGFLENFGLIIVSFGQAKQVF
jgi:hypothetical protein